MNELELKRKRIETIAKVAGLLGVTLILGPFYLVILHGIGALAALAGATVIGLTAVNFIPWFAMKLANWKLKALKAEAAANPIETLENQYKEREQGLVAFRENILSFHAEVQNFYSELEEQGSSHPELKVKFEEQYNKMRQLLAVRSEKYKLAQKKLKDFSDLIDQKRSEWKLAQAAAKMTKAAGVGEDFISKLMEDTSVNSVQTSLNTAFAELEVSLLDEQPVNGTTAVADAAPVKALAEKVGPPVLDLDVDINPGKSTRQKIAVA